MTPKLITCEVWKTTGGRLQHLTTSVRYSCVWVEVQRPESGSRARSKCSPTSQTFVANSDSPAMTEGAEGRCGGPIELAHDTSASRRSRSANELGRGGGGRGQRTPRPHHPRVHRAAAAVH